MFPENSSVGNDDEEKQISASPSGASSTVSMISPPCSPAADTILDADATDNEPELIDSVGVDDAKSARSSSERDDASAKSSSKEGTTSPITAPKLPTSEDGESQAELPAPKLGLISVALAKGIRYVDNPEAPFGCPHCNKSYASKKSLSRHTRDSMCAKNRKEGTRLPPPKPQIPDSKFKLPNPLKRLEQPSHEESFDRAHKRQRREESLEGKDCLEVESEEMGSEGMADVGELNAPTNSVTQSEQAHQASQALPPSTSSSKDTPTKDSDFISFEDRDYGTPSGHTNGDSDLSTQELIGLAESAGLTFDTYHPIPNYGESFEQMAYTQQQAWAHKIATQAQWGGYQDRPPASPTLQFGRDAAKYEPRRSAQTGENYLANTFAAGRPGFSDSSIPSAIEAHRTVPVSSVPKKLSRSRRIHPDEFAPDDVSYTCTGPLEPEEESGINPAKDEALTPPVLPSLPKTSQLPSQVQLPHPSTPVQPRIRLYIRSPERTSNGSFTYTGITLARTQVFEPIWQEYSRRRNKHFGTDLAFTFTFTSPNPTTTDAGATNNKQTTIRLHGNMTPEDVTSTTFPTKRMEDGDVVACVALTPKPTRSLATNPTTAAAAAAVVPGAQFATNSSTDERIQTMVLHHNRILAAHDASIRNLHTSVAELQHQNARLSLILDGMRAKYPHTLNHADLDGTTRLFNKRKDGSPSAFVAEGRDSHDGEAK